MSPRIDPKRNLLIYFLKSGAPDQRPLPDIYTYSHLAAPARYISYGCVVPHQIEIHPPPKGTDLCWMACKHCYTQTPLDEPARISSGRLVDLVEEISQGSPISGRRIKKVILSGFRTDPLNSEAIGPLLSKLREKKIVTGVHTKGKCLDQDIADLLLDASSQEDYITFSIDAGDAKTYAKVHGLAEDCDVYDQVIANITNLAKMRAERKSSLKIRATYLITEDNANSQIWNFTRTLLSAGVDSVRFSKPIYTCMGKQERVSRFTEASQESYDRAEKMIYGLKLFFNDRVAFQESCPKVGRTLPCYSKWVMPVIGYDGFLYPCCLVASKEFESLRLADLKTVGFWESYHKERLDIEIDPQSQLYVDANCHCDRKASEVNMEMKIRILGLRAKK